MVSENCLCCDEAILPEDQADTQRLWPGGCKCKVHPLHRWCGGWGMVMPRSSRCSDCDQPFERTAIMAICRWARERLDGYHLAAVGIAPTRRPRPPGIWCVQFRWEPMLIVPFEDAAWFDSLSIIDRAVAGGLPDQYRLYHEQCPNEDDTWPARIRAARSDLDLKLVYADVLEEAGQDARAGYVREVVAHRRGEDAMPSAVHDVPHWFRRLISAR